MARKRGNNCGSLFKRSKTGYWIAAWKPRGEKRCEKSTGETDRRLAEKALHRFMAEEAAPRVAAAARSLDDHFEDFEGMLKAKGNTRDHVVGTIGHVKRVAKLCKALRIVDLKPLTVQQAVAQIKAEGRSLRTCNATLRSVKTFMSWLERESRVRENVLRHLSGFNANTDRRRQRRALTDVELSRLINVANKGPIVLGICGVDRAMAYDVATGSGFRADEMQSLIVPSFVLDADPPIITVSAAYTKNGEEAPQPIRRDLAERLRPWLASKDPEKPALPLPDRTCDMLKVDLKAAGIPCQDQSGRFCDFHALRVSYITAIVRGGATVKQAMALARHSDHKLTLNVYTKLGMTDLTSALDGLPDLDVTTTATAGLKTGTYDANADADEPTQPLTQPVHEPAQPSAAPRDEGGETTEGDDAHKSLSFATHSDEARHNATPSANGPCWIRTSDHQIMSPAL
jgi:site-specific recombinase XerC